MRSAPLFVSGAAGLPGEQGPRHRAWETRKACGDVSFCFPRRWGRRAGAVQSWRRGPGRSGGSCPRWAKLQQQCGHRGRPGTVPTPLGSCPTDGLDDGHAPRPPPPSPLPRPAACRALWQPRRPPQPVFQPCASSAVTASGCRGLFTIRLISELEQGETSPTAERVFAAAGGRAGGGSVPALRGPGAPRSHRPPPAGAGGWHSETGKSWLEFAL